MKTSLLTIILLHLIVAFSFSQTKDEERERLKIANNKVKQITQWSHRYKQGKPEQAGYKTSETKYDRNGNPIEITNYRANGDVSSRALYKYNDKNQRVEYVFYQKDKKPQLEITNKQNYQYDSKGNKILEVRFDGATQSRIVYEYHPDSRPKSIVSTSAGNKINEKWEYFYEGNNQEIKVFDGSQNLLSSTKRKFNSKGSVIEEVRFDGKGKELKRQNFTFNNNDQMIEMVEHYAGAFIKKLTYKLDAQGQVIEVTQENPDGTRFTQSSFKFDPKGNLLEERWSEGDPNEFSHKQSSYDGKGNPLEVDSYYAPYKFRVLYKYTYDYY